MRKVIIGIMAVAMLAIIPAAASADVARCEASVPGNTVIKTATFTVTQPSGSGGLWTHDFTVTVNPEDNTFAGVGVVNGLDVSGPTTFNEDVAGTFNADGTVSITKSNRAFNYVDSWSLLNAKTDGTETQGASMPAVSWELWFKVTAPVFTTSTTSTPGTASVKNHGQFVKAQGGGKTAAQACAGMPLNSTQGSSTLK